MNTISAALVGLTLVCLPAFAESPLDDLSAGDIADGERLFRIHCARCHGIDGAGGEGSNLARPKLNYATDDIALMAILNEGMLAAMYSVLRQLRDGRHCPGSSMSSRCPGIRNVAGRSITAAAAVLPATLSPAAARVSGPN